jgi:dihydrofolate synthase / folylpolyglutamate synthase
MIKNFQQAIDYLKTTVPDNKHKYPGGLGLERQIEILRLLGDPQNKVSAIHIAGTSGKGSTCFYLSSLLVSHGFKVGLTVSPHLIDIRERFQINNSLISKKEFLIYLNQVIPIINSVDYKKFGKPTYFEILIALAFYIFYKKKVDYMVVETGLGGLMDGSNTITSPNQVCVFTKFGLDHTSVLGKNITSIATQKTGIIHPQNPVFSVHQIKVARDVLSKQSAKNKTTVNYISPVKNFKNIKTKNGFLEYNFSDKNLNLKNLKLNSLGLYQVENSALALSVVNFLGARDKFNLNPQKIRQTFSSVSFPGRIDVKIVRNQQVILDGAHNPQKMMALVKSLKKSFPGQKFVFLLAFKQRKDFSKMIRMLIPFASEIIITKFLVTTQDMIQKSQSYISLKKTFSKLNFFNFKYIPDKSKALDYITKTNQPIVITGSLYLLSVIYPILKTNSFS